MNSCGIPLHMIIAHLKFSGPYCCLVISSKLLVLTWCLDYSLYVFVAYSE